MTPVKIQDKEGTPPVKRPKKTPVKAKIRDKECIPQTPPPKIQDKDGIPETQVKTKIQDKEGTPPVKRQNF